MALATDSQGLNHHTKGRGVASGDSVGSKDAFSMPAPRPPPSPPATETDIGTEIDTEAEPDSYPFPPFVDVSEQLSETIEYNDDDGNAAAERTVLSLNTGNAQENEGSQNGTEHNTQSDDQTPVISPVSPPYWTRNSQEQTHSHGHGHMRTVSGASFGSVSSNTEGLGITLRDNENSSTDDRGSACWAKSVEVTDYVLVNGSKTNIGAFIVWIIRVETLNVSLFLFCTHSGEVEILIRPAVARD
jgi:hypothetical protein